MAIRYVLDPHVASQLLRDEPHLRSIIRPEEYEDPDEIILPEQLTRALTNAVEGQSALPGTMYVTSVQQTSYDVSRSSSGGTVWEAQYVIYGHVPE